MTLVRSVSMESGDRSLIGMKHKREQEKNQTAFRWVLCCNKEQLVGDAVGLKECGVK